MFQHIGLLHQTKTILKLKKIINIDFSQPKTMNPDCRQPQKRKIDYIKKFSKTLDDNQIFHNFLSKLETVNSNAAILKVILPYNFNFTKDKLPNILSKTYSDENVKRNKEELLNLGSEMDFSLNQSDCDQIEIAISSKPN